MDYDIIATLGPKSNTSVTWKAMLSAGATAFRLNTSHLTIPQLNFWIEAYQAFISPLQTRPFLILDLQGSKWRLGHFSSYELLEGQIIDLIDAESTEQSYTLPVPHHDFFKAAVTSGPELVLNDARVRLKVEVMGESTLRTVVVKGGKISANKGITFVNGSYRKESLSEKDQNIFEETRHYNFIRYAVSYIKDSNEMSRYRKLLGKSTYLIAKLERAAPVLDEPAQIARIADEMWLCRGDLGAELGIKAMAVAVQKFSQDVKRYKVPIFLAGQVLEHMVEQPSPTRSEICYLYEALIKGYKGVVLSDETAIGRFPVESCLSAAIFRSESNTPSN
jgi:pyruvate kinase